MSHNCRILPKDRYESSAGSSTRLVSARHDQSVAETRNRNTIPENTTMSDNQTDRMNRDLTRRRVLAGSAVTVGATSSTAPVTGDPDSEPPCDRDQPNFVFNLADDLGYGELGFTPYNRDQVIRTPNIQQMAREGIRFSDFYAGSPVCAPDRCSTLTGNAYGSRPRPGEPRPPQPGRHPAPGRHCR